MKKLNVPLSEYKERIVKCQEKAKKAGFDALLVWSHSPDRTGNVKYLTNYAASILYNPSSLLSQPPRRGTSDTCVVLPLEGEPTLIKMKIPSYPDNMFPPLVEIAVKNIKEFERDITDAVAEVVRKNHLENKRIGVAGEDAISAFLMHLITKKLPKAEFGYADEILAEMRMTMSHNEIKLVKKTGELADRLLKAAVEAVKPGVTQREIASLIASNMTKEGVERILFIDCSPGLPTEYWKVPDKVIEDDEIVQIDFGFEDGNGYVADVCRTIVAGRASKKKREIVRLGRETIDFVASTAVPGMKGQEWLKKTREFVDKRLKSGDYSIPAPWPIMYLGNAMGLDMQPMFFDSEANMKVKEGIFLSLEIWLYVPGLGASRFEELVLVTKKGSEFLTKYRHDI